MPARRAPKTLCGGKYRVDGVLGEGGMGTVYAVTQLRVNRAYALKKLHPNLRLRPDIHRRFLREGWFANAVAVEHAGAVQVFEDGLDDDGLPFLVMELLEGATVDALGPKPGGKLPLRETLCIAHQLLDVLHAAHEKRIVHRDIKPANLFVCHDGRLKVLDFGISKLRSMPSHFGGTATHSLVGTPAFMSPEQARAQGTDPSSDLFSVGATLFMMLSGEPLHLGDGAHEVIRRASSEPARSLAEVDPEMPPAVVELVAKAVAFDATRRWQSAAAMRDAVLQVHRASFGSLDMTRLAALVREQPSPRAGSPLSIGDLATEPCPRSQRTRSGPVGSYATQRVTGDAPVPYPSLPSLLSPVELPRHGGTVGLSALASFTPSSGSLRSTLLISAVAAVLLAAAPTVLQKPQRSPDVEPVGKPSVQPSTATPTRPVTPAPEPVTSAGNEAPRGRARPAPTAASAAPATKAAATPASRRSSLAAPATTAASVPVSSAAPAPTPPLLPTPLLPTPFLPPGLPLPDE